VSRSRASSQSMVTEQDGQRHSVAPASSTRVVMVLRAKMNVVGQLLQLGFVQQKLERLAKRGPGRTHRVAARRRCEMDNVPAVVSRRFNRPARTGSQSASTFRTAYGAGTMRSLLPCGVECATDVLTGECEARITVRHVYGVKVGWSTCWMLCGQAGMAVPSLRIHNRLCYRVANEFAATVAMDRVVLTKPPFFCCYDLMGWWG